MLQKQFVQVSFLRANFGLLFSWIWEALGSHFRGLWDAKGCLKRKRRKHEKPMFSLKSVFKVSGLPFRHGNLEKIDYGSRACFEMIFSRILLHFKSLWEPFGGLNPIFVMPNIDEISDARF